MRVAVLALQGAFIEHERMLQRLGVEIFEIRQLSDWQQPKDGLFRVARVQFSLSSLRIWGCLSLLYLT